MFYVNKVDIFAFISTSKQSKIDVCVVCVFVFWNIKQMLYAIVSNWIGSNKRIKMYIIVSQVELVADVCTKYIYIQIIERHNVKNRKNWQNANNFLAQNAYLIRLKLD